MNYQSDQHGHVGHTIKGFLAGALLGGLAGAGAMLLYAPQSGKRTRDQIQRKSEALREQATDLIDETVEQARAGGRRISAGLHKQAGKIEHQARKMQQHGQHLVDEQKERWTPVVAAGQKAVQGKS
jgi:gas vesicle protein